MIKFIKSLYYYLLLYRVGYYFSGNAHVKLGTNTYGFTRLNYRDNVTHKYSIVDIDFEVGRYSHLHGDADFRVEYNQRWYIAFSVPDNCWQITAIKPDDYLTSFATLTQARNKLDRMLGHSNYFIRFPKGR